MSKKNVVYLVLVLSGAILVACAVMIFWPADTATADWDNVSTVAGSDGTVAPVESTPTPSALMPVATPVADDIAVAPTNVAPVESAPAESALTPVTTPGADDTVDAGVQDVAEEISASQDMDPADTPMTQALPEAEAVATIASGFIPNTAPTAQPQVDPEQPLWDLYAEGKLGEMAAEIVKISAAQPSWTPSEELSTQMGVLADTERLLNAAASQQYGLVMKIATDTPAVLSCTRPDVLWAANAAVYTQMDATNGIEMFVQNMASCITDAAVRDDHVRRLGAFMTPIDMATVRTRIADPALDDAFDAALITTDLTQVQSWLEGAGDPRYVRPGDEDVEQTSGDATLTEGALRPVVGGSVFFPEVSDIAGQTTDVLMSTIGQGAAVDGLYVSTTEIPQEILDARKRLEDNRELMTPAQILSLGWYDYAAGDPRSAAQIFEEARVYDDAGIDVVRGEVLARMAYEDYITAEQLIPEATDDWRTDTTYLLSAADLVAHADRSVDDILYREGLSLSREQAERIQAAALATQDWDVTEKLGWHSHRLAGCDAALPWWRIAHKSNPDLEPAAYGIAMCLATAQGTPEMQAIREIWSPQSPRIAMIFGDWAYTALAERPLPRPSDLSTTGVSPSTFVASSGPRVLTREDVPAVQPEMIPAQAPAETVQQPSADVMTSAPQSAPAAPVQTPTPARTATPRAQPTQPAVPVARASNVDACDPTVPLASLSAAQALERGWCLMEQNNEAAAEGAFAAARASGDAQVRSDAAYGESLKHLRTGDYQAAQETLLSEPQDTRRRNEISAGILSAQAAANVRRSNGRTALEALERRQQFAQESPDIMTMRGWALWNSNKKAEARRVWQEAAELGDAGAKTALREAGR